MSGRVRELGDEEARGCLPWIVDFVIIDHRTFPAPRFEPVAWRGYTARCESA